MPKRPDLFSELLAIGCFAPLVIGARLTRLAADRPASRAGRREAARMIAEKPMAAWEGALLAERSLLSSTIVLWSELTSAATNFALAASVAPITAVQPVRRRVRANARRLTGF